MEARSGVLIETMRLADAGFSGTNLSSSCRSCGALRTAQAIRVLL